MQPTILKPRSHVHVNWSTLLAFVQFATTHSAYRTQQATTTNKPPQSQTSTTSTYLQLLHPGSCCSVVVVMSAPCLDMVTASLIVPWLGGSCWHEVDAIVLNGIAGVGL